MRICILSLVQSKFPGYVTEKLGWYVYALQDPRNKRIFYIGKGKGSRVFAHANAAVSEKEIGASNKLSLIQEIISSGYSVNALIIRHAISSEKDSYAIESVLIDFCEYLDSNVDKPIFDLTNLVKGHDYLQFGLMTAESVVNLYHAPKCPRIEEKSILLRIPNLWTPNMDASALYEATRGWWSLSEKRKEKVELAIAVHNGIARGVYKISKWEKRSKGQRGWKYGEKPRWGFVGEDISNSSIYQNTNVSHLFSAKSQQPVKYLNC